MKKILIANHRVHLESLGSPRASVLCEYEGARYHVWVDRKTDTIESILYKNPLLDAEDQFRTRSLDRTSKRNAAIVGAMMQGYKQKLAAEYQRLEAEQHSRELAAQQMRAKQMKEKHAETLFNACRRYVQEGYNMSTYAQAVAAVALASQEPT